MTKLMDKAIEIMSAAELHKGGMCSGHIGDHTPMRLFSLTRAYRYSAGGAIMRASFELGYGRGLTDPDVTSVLDAIHNLCEKDKSMKGFLRPVTLDMIEAWNDSPRVTKEMVIEKFKLWNSRI